MKLIFTTLIVLFSYASSQAQLSQGTWLVGGTASLYATQNTFTSTISSAKSDVLRINLSPSVGYFVAEKLAVGLRPGYSKIKSETAGPGGGNTNENRLDFGPFGRYYFLSADKPFNLLADASYQYGLYWFTPDKGSRHTFSVSAGIAAFFNSSVAVELMAGYYTQNERIRNSIETQNEYKGLQLTIGFQFHLEK